LQGIFVRPTSFDIISFPGPSAAAAVAAAAVAAKHQHSQQNPGHHALRSSTTRVKSAPVRSFTFLRMIGEGGALLLFCCSAFFRHHQKREIVLYFFLWRSYSPHAAAAAVSACINLVWCGYSHNYASALAFTCRRMLIDPPFNPLVIKQQQQPPSTGVGDE
jgi:hypothetical protein